MIVWVGACKLYYGDGDVSIYLNGFFDMKKSHENEHTSSS